MIILLGAISGPLGGQQVVDLRQDTECERCRIEIVKGVALGEEDGEGMIEHSSSRVVRDARGNFILNGSYSTTLKVFDRSGRFVRSFGRDGGGPGEFRGVGSMVVLPADTLVVFDWGTRRYSLFSPEYEYISAGPLPLSPELDAAALPGGDFVFNATLSGGKSLGLPLHRVGRDGKIALSFGAKATEYRPGVPYQMSRAISPAGGSLLWSGLQASYQVDLLDVRNGETVRSLRRNVDWFAPGVAPVPRGRESLEPKPFIFDVVQDSAGLLWVLIGVADPNWRDAIAAGGPHGNQVIDENGYRDAVLEVIDPVAGTVLATARMDDRIAQFVGPGLIGTVVEDDDGVRFQTWSVRLVRGSAR